LENINNIKSIAKQIIQEELEAIKNLLNYINDDFVKAVSIINKTQGRVVVTGIGKSAIIASKMVATLNSTGTPAIMLHAADALHGDVGTITNDDIVICISKSGNTPEIKALVSLLKSFNNKIIAIVGNINSFLAKQADIVINTTVEKEADLNNLAPTSSTTAQLVMADAIAMTLVYLKGFKSQDFAKFHPAGILGKQMYLRVSDLIVNNPKPITHINDPINDVIIEISSKRLGMTTVIDNDNNIVGIITDGDLRRQLQKNINLISQLKAKDIMTPNPKILPIDTLAIDALAMMRKHSITSIIIIDNNNNYAGVVHIHDIIREGII